MKKVDKKESLTKFELSSFLSKISTIFSTDSLKLSFSELVKMAIHEIEIIYIADENTISMTRIIGNEIIGLLNENLIINLDWISDK